MCATLKQRSPVAVKKRMPLRPTWWASPHVERIPMHTAETFEGHEAGSAAAGWWGRPLPPTAASERPSETNETVLLAVVDSAAVRPLLMLPPASEERRAEWFAKAIRPVRRDVGPDGIAPAGGAWWWRPTIGCTAAGALAVPPLLPPRLLPALSARCRAFWWWKLVTIGGARPPLLERGAGEEARCGGAPPSLEGV